MGDTINVARYIASRYESEYCTQDVVFFFDEYACKESWSLSRLSHGELSWKNSRVGIDYTENSDNPMKTQTYKRMR